MVPSIRQRNYYHLFRQEMLFSTNTGKWKQSENEKKSLLRLYLPCPKNK